MKILLLNLLKELQMSFVFPLFEEFSNNCSSFSSICTKLHLKRLPDCKICAIITDFTLCIYERTQTKYSSLTTQNYITLTTTQTIQCTTFLSFPLSKQQTFLLNRERIKFITYQTTLIHIQKQTRNHMFTHVEKSRYVILCIAYYYNVQMFTLCLRFLYDKEHRTNNKFIYISFY